MSALYVLFAMGGAFAAAWTLGGRRRLYGRGPDGNPIEDLFKRVAAWGPVSEMRERARSERFTEACREGVPEMLDILTLGLSAGLSFDAALDLYCSRFQTELSQLMDRTRLSWSLGLDSRAGALEAMARESRVDALERFAMAVTESLAFGAPLVDTLVRQAQAIRADHRHRVEEAIEKVPVKMLIPMGVLVLPAMLIAILGPLLGPALLGMA